MKSEEFLFLRFLAAYNSLPCVIHWVTFRMSGEPTKKTNLTTTKWFKFQIRRMKGECRHMSFDSQLVPNIKLNNNFYLSSTHHDTAIYYLMKIIRLTQINYCPMCSSNSMLSSWLKEHVESEKNAEGDYWWFQVTAIYATISSDREHFLYVLLKNRFANNTL